VSVHHARLAGVLSLALLIGSGCAVVDSFAGPDPVASTAALNDSLWHFDFGVVGQGGLDVGSRTFYNFVSVGNVGSEPIQLDDVKFPELEDGLRITRVGLYSESEPELAPGEDPFPIAARPIDGSVILEPTGGAVQDIEVAFTDPRFYGIYVEVEVVEEGQWSIGPMDLTYTEAGETRRQRISNEVGDACTTPIEQTCMPWAS
jgi:hypothetical protein